MKWLVFNFRRNMKPSVSTPPPTSSIASRLRNKSRSLTNFSDKSSSCNSNKSIGNSSGRTAKPGIGFHILKNTAIKFLFRPVRPLSRPSCRTRSYRICYNSGLFNWFYNFVDSYFLRFCEKASTSSIKTNQAHRSTSEMKSYTILFHSIDIIL